LEEKYCSQCENWYPLSEFNKKQASWDSYETKHKACAQKKSATFRQENPTYDKKYQEKNSEELKTYKKEYYKKKRLEFSS
jgi:hypothetical protein